MALITRIGGRESDSFVTVAEADVIIENLPDDTASWEDLEEVEKELRLRMGVQLMATMRFAGRRVYCGQALCFPRTTQTYRNTIPDVVKEVQVFVAYSVIHRALANRPSSVTEEWSGNRVTRVSLGGLLSVGFSGEPIAAGTALDALVRSAQFPAYLLLQPYLTQVRGGSVPDADEETCSTTTTTTSTTSTTSTTLTTTTT